MNRYLTVLYAALTGVEDDLNAALAALSERELSRLLNALDQVTRLVRIRRDALRRLV